MDKLALTFVTVVYEAELSLLHIQARSMDRYLDPSQVSKIYVIDNSTTPLGESDRASVIDAYGHLGDRVRLVTVDELDIPRAESGYIRQQLAKLLIARIVEDAWYICLDAKNVFVSSSLEGFLIQDGRPVISRYSFANHPLKEKLLLSLKYMGVRPKDHLTSFTPTVTPYPIYSAVARDLISAVERRENSSFSHAFTRCGLTEFFLYGAWIIKSGVDVESLYIVGDRLPSVWPKSVNEGGLDQALVKARATGAPIFTVHRKAIANLNEANVAKLATFWAEREVFASVDEGIRFVEQIRTSAKPSPGATTARAVLVRIRRKVGREMERLRYRRAASGAPWKHEQGGWS